MARNGTVRGGARVGAGRRPNALADKIVQGRTADVISLPEPPEMEGIDVPPVKDYMKASQKSGIELCAGDVFRSTYLWLKERGCERHVNTQLIEQYAMSVSRWVQCETCISEYGFLAKHPTTGAAMVDLIGTECGVERHVQIFKEKGIWIEDGTITPEPGYIIVFNWGKDSQPNDGFSDHIGVVDSVKNGTITCIEGNRNDAVSYRSIPVGWGYIRGYAAPKYDKADDTSAAGQEDPSTGVPSKVVKCKGQVTASILNVRSWAGMSYPNIKSVPYLKYGTTVEICDAVKAADGSDWYYVLIDGRIYGFVSADYIREV